MIAYLHTLLRMAVVMCIHAAMHLFNCMMQAPVFAPTIAFAMLSFHRQQSLSLSGSVKILITRSTAFDKVVASSTTQKTLILLFAAVSRPPQLFHSPSTHSSDVRTLQHHRRDERQLQPPCRESPPTKVSRETWRLSSALLRLKTVHGNPSRGR